MQSFLFMGKLSFLRVRVRVRVIYVPKITNGKTRQNSEINNVRRSPRRRKKMF